jgi:DNA-binding MarR family transcriptional regulator
MSALGLSTAKMRALAVLSVEDGIAINTLSVFAVVEQSTLSRALDKLQADGLVRRAADPEDNRSFRVFLTDAGRVVNASLWPHMRAEQDRMFAGVDDNQRAAFLDTLHKMLENVRVHEF